MKALSVVLFSFLVIPVHAGDWPGFLGPSRNCVSNEKGLIKEVPKGGPRLQWKKEVGEGYSSPVIQGNRLILFHRSGNLDLVECLGVTTGKRLWKFEYETSYRDALGKGDGPRSTPLIAKEFVYTLSADGRLHCLNLKTGKKVWMRNLAKEYQSPQGYFGVSTSPIFEANQVIINVGGREAGIVSLDAQTGKTKWTATDHRRSYASPIAVSVGKTRHLIFFTRRGIVSLNPVDGKVRFDRRWRARIDASVNATSPLMVDGNHIFVTTSYSTGAFVAKVDDTSLKDLWSNDISLSSHYSPATVQDEYVYGFDGRQEEGARLRCIAWKTGKVMWNKANFGCGAFILAEGKLITLTEEGELVFIEATEQGYRERGRASVFDGVCRAHLALSNGRLFARDSSTLKCWDIRK